MEATEKREDVLGYSGKPHPQYQDELAGLIRILQEEGVRSYLEIGCRYGDTYHQVALGLPKGSRVVGVDLPGAKSGFKRKGGHQDSFEYLQRAVHHLSSIGYDAHAILGDSHEQETADRAARLGPYDAILIDGDHSAAGVERDWALYGSMGRIVAFHDIAGTGKWARQIRPIFDRLSKGRKHREIVSDGLRRGIGVVWNA